MHRNAITEDVDVVFVVIGEGRGRIGSWLPILLDVYNPDAKLSVGAKKSLTGRRTAFK
jgi:hypothetical protein